MVLLTTTLTPTLSRAAGEGVEPNINPRRIELAVRLNALTRQQRNHSILNPHHHLTHAVARAFEIQQHVHHRLPRPVIRDLAAAVCFDYGDIRWVEQQVLRLACNALREHGRVLADPQLVLSLGCARIGECAHRVPCLLIVDAT
jgi:hypothetical protein